MCIVGQSSEQSEEFDCVIVCNGLFNRPKYPNIPSLANFKGTIMHSGAYFEPYIFKNKTVLVYGKLVGHSLPYLLDFGLSNQRSGILTFDRPCNCRATFLSHNLKITAIEYIYLYLSISIYIHLYLSIYLISISFYLPLYLFIYLSIYLSISIYISI